MERKGSFNSKYLLAQRAVSPGYFMYTIPLNEPMRSVVFVAKRQGLGAALISSHYDYIGGGIQVPHFLSSPKTVSVIGAPMSYGQPRAGTDQGAKMLHEAGLDEMLNSLEWTIDSASEDLVFDAPGEDDPQVRSVGCEKRMRMVRMMA